jgi:hypothetical protein
VVRTLKHKNNDIVPQIFIAVVGVVLIGIIVFYVISSTKSTSGLADEIIADT